MNCPGTLTTLFSMDDFAPICDFCARKFERGLKVIPPHEADPRQMPLDADAGLEANR